MHRPHGHGTVRSFLLRTGSKEKGLDVRLPTGGHRYEPAAAAGGQHGYRGRPHPGSRCGNGTHGRNAGVRRMRRRPGGDGGLRHVRRRRHSHLSRHLCLGGSLQPNSGQIQARCRRHPKRRQGDEPDCGNHGIRRRQHRVAEEPVFPKGDGRTG